MMPPRGSSASPQRVTFHETKYGRELLLDAAFVRQMPAFLGNGCPHVLTFHDILLVTRGAGLFLLDGEPHRVAPGVVFFTRPGQVREWRLRSRLDGACLFFAQAFVAGTFSDPRFLDQFTYFAPARPAAALTLKAGAVRVFLGRFQAMQREIARLRSDAPDALRALLYETLVTLNRSYAARHGATGGGTGGVVERFERLVERDFRSRHRVAAYASDLGVSPGHLNVLCRSRLHAPAGDVIRARVALEAKRLLLYTELSAAEIADRLGFDDPSYFTRFFRREVGSPPTRYRLGHRRRGAGGRGGATARPAGRG